MEAGKIFMEILDKAAPLKSKYLRKDHRKAKTHESRMKYKKQRNVCQSISWKLKKGCYENLDLKVITENRMFWATLKPLFSNKIKSTEYITLEKNGNIISSNKEVARISNKFFVNIVPST